MTTGQRSTAADAQEKLEGAVSVFRTLDPGANLPVVVEEIYTIGAARPKEGFEILWAIWIMEMPWRPPGRVEDVDHVLYIALDGMDSETKVFEARVTDTVKVNLTSQWFSLAHCRLLAQILRDLGHSLEAVVVVADGKETTLDELLPGNSQAEQWLSTLTAHLSP